MLKRSLYLSFLLSLLIFNSGCAFLWGVGVGTVGGYMVSCDTIQGEIDKSFEEVWNAALKVSRILGSVRSKSKDLTSANMRVNIDKSVVDIKLYQLTKDTIRLKVSARRYLMPHLSLAQKVFFKIIQEAK